MPFIPEDRFITYIDSQSSMVRRATVPKGKIAPSLYGNPRGDPDPINGLTLSVAVLGGWGRTSSVLEKNRLLHIERPKEFLCLPCANVFIGVHTNNQVVSLVQPCFENQEEIFIEQRARILVSFLA